MSSFLDTNVVVYAYDDSDPVKQHRAQAILGTGGWVVSTQVMQEFFVTVTRRIARPLATPDALAVLDLLALASVAPMDANAVRRAAEATTRHQLSLWDALIVDAAVTAGCDRLLTEDLNAGQVFDGVTVVNPFA